MPAHATNIITPLFPLARPTGELSKHAVSEGTKAVTKFTSGRSGGLRDNQVCHLGYSSDVSRWPLTPSSPCRLNWRRTACERNRGAVMLLPSGLTNT